MRLAYLTLSIVLLNLISCSEDDPITAPIQEDETNASLTAKPIPVLSENNYVLDSLNSLLLYNGNDLDLGNSLIIQKDTFEITPVDESLQLGKSYTLTNGNTSYAFYRTQIPLISITTNDIEIPDEPKISGKLRLLDSENEPFESFIGIERRGGFSQTFPKKSYSMELWEDATGDDDIKESLLGLRDDDDWILDGLWNEPLRIRDYTSHDLWLKIARFPHSEKEPETTLGINRKYCEVFLNGTYTGIYYLGEKVDRKQLGLKKYKDEIRGELYKGDENGLGVHFNAVESFSNSSLTWSGFEAKYPEDDGELDWANLHTFVDFVVNSDEETFNAEIQNFKHIPNAVDYFIFLNITYATDNRGKNTYLAKYNEDTPYFYVAWDMDGTFGNSWTGERLDSTEGILTNGLFNRLVNNPAFKEELKSRWAYLKNNELSFKDLTGMFTKNYAYLRDNGVYSREALYEDLPQNYSENEINFIQIWIINRLNTLDAYISQL